KLGLAQGSERGLTIDARGVILAVHRAGRASAEAGAPAFGNLSQGANYLLAHPSKPSLRLTAEDLLSSAVAAIPRGMSLNGAAAAATGQRGPPDWPGERGVQNFRRELNR